MLNIFHGGKNNGLVLQTCSIRWDILRSKVR